MEAKNGPITTTRNTVSEIIGKEHPEQVGIILKLFSVKFLLFNITGSSSIRTFRLVGRRTGSYG
jgi:hypothetical protein